VRVVIGRTYCISETVRSARLTMMPRFVIESGFRSAAAATVNLLVPLQESVIVEPCCASAGIISAAADSITTVARVNSRPIPTSPQFIGERKLPQKFGRIHPLSDQFPALIMSKPETVTQCRLRVRDASEMVSFIDSDAAVLGKRITIDDFPGIIWEVVYVGDTISREALQKQESYHRTHRKGTDI